MNDAHDDGSEIFEPCAVCGIRDEDVEKCVVADCFIYLHKSCADSCESCGGAICSDHSHEFYETKVCSSCLPEVERLAVEDEQEMSR